jgi:hypothetical protein
MQYKLALQGIDLATYSFAVGERVEDVAGKKAITVQSHAKAVGLVAMIAKLDDRFTSWIDVETGRPLRFQTDEFATGSKTDIEHTVIDLAGRTGDTIPITFHINDAPPTPEPQKVTLPEIWDYNAFVVALRAWEGAPGTSISAEVFRSRFLWHVDIKIRGKEKLTTELPELSEVTALRFDAHTYKLTRDGAKFPGNDERDFSVWISDDDGRVPLQTVAKTDYGDIKMKIVEYVAGSGERLRK